MTDPARIQFHLDRLHGMATPELSPARAAALSRIAGAAARGVRRGRRRAALSQFLSRLVPSLGASRPVAGRPHVFSSSP